MLIEYDWDGYTFSIALELWRIREWFYKTINRVYLLLGKDYFFIDYGYCRREKSELKCGVGIQSDEPCIKEKCGIFAGEEDEA